MQLFNPYYANPGGLTPGGCSAGQHLQGCTPVYAGGRWWCSCLAAPPPSPGSGQGPSVSARPTRRRRRRRMNPGPMLRSVKAKTPKTLTYRLSQWISVDPPRPSKSKSQTKRTTVSSSLSKRSLINPSCGCS